MKDARKIYRNLDVDEFLALEDERFQLDKNFHISFWASNLLYLDGPINLCEYISY